MHRALNSILAGALTTCLLLPAPVLGEDFAGALEAVGDVVYKGVVGKALDAVPMEADQRVALQRANAVLSGTMTGRSLSVWVGLTNPILAIGGLVWGLFAASRINPEDAGTATHAKIQSAARGLRTELAGTDGDRLESEFPAGTAVIAGAVVRLRDEAPAEDIPAQPMTFELAAAQSQPRAPHPAPERVTALAVSF